MQDDQIVELLKVAEEAARAAGVLLRDTWREPKTVVEKGFRDWVTDVDVAAQEMIVGLIRDRYPAHGFLAEEEMGDLRQHGTVRWIIDPIDGTTNFSRQQPIFSISIAAVAGGETLLGLIFDPLRDEMFTAKANDAARLNGEAIYVSQAAKLEDAIIALDWAHSRQDRQATLDSVQRVGSHVRTIRTFGSAALALAWLAAGRLDGYWSWRLNVWDMAAGAFLIERAGGKCTTITGAPLPGAGSSSCLAGNTLLHRTLMAVAGENPQSTG